MQTGQDGTVQHGTPGAGSTKRKIPLLSQQLDAPMHELSTLPPPSSSSTSVTMKRKKKSGNEEDDDDDESEKDPLGLLLMSSKTTKQTSRKQVSSTTTNGPTAMGSAPELIGHDIAEDDERDFEEDTASMLEKDWKKREDNIRQRMELAYQGMKGILDRLSPLEQRRYDTFRRSAIQRPVLRKWMAQYLSTQSQAVKNHPNVNVTTIHPNIQIIMAGISKIYVGELVETALQIQQEWKDDPSQGLLPSHIRAAFMRFQQKSGNLSQEKFVFQSKKRHL